MSEDFDVYPTQTDQDLSLLGSLGFIDVVFMPSSETLYSNHKCSSGHNSGFNSFEGYTDTSIINPRLSKLLEGASRPHFFSGVLTILGKLMNIVEPDVMILGQKDIQQYIVVKQMIKDLFYKTKLVLGPTQRNVSGLALSSRNKYLTSEEYQLAHKLYQSLRLGKGLFDCRTTNKSSVIISRIVDNLPRCFEVDYVSVVDKTTLESIEEISYDEGALLVAAVKIAKTRLIDNILLGIDIDQI